jgi:hypothetical protein
MTVSTVRTVTVEVPVTLTIGVELSADDGTAPRDVALKAAEHFAHVSEAHIHAFNEVARVQDGVRAVVTAVTTTIG